MKQAWAFAWRSLMAGELLVIIAQQPPGVQLQLQRDLRRRGPARHHGRHPRHRLVVDLLLFGTLDGGSELAEAW